MNYQFNPQMAKEADNGGMYLTQAGAYTGRFTRAEKLVSGKTGAHGVGLTFEADNGQGCRFDLWTMNADQSQQYHGLRHINAIMACLGLGGLQTQPGTLERWNPQTRQREKFTGHVYPEMTGRPIGVVLQRVEYDKFEGGFPTGKTAFKLELYGVYRAQDHFTASEILEKAVQPQKLEKMIAAAMKDRLLDGGKKAQAAQNSIDKANAAAKDASRNTGGYKASEMYEDDDIPFIYTAIGRETENRKSRRMKKYGW